MKIRPVRLVLFLALAGSIFLFFSFISIVNGETAGHLVISQIQVAGETADDEFIELFNPNSKIIDLDGWKLTKKNSSGVESTILSSLTSVKMAGIIPPFSYFLIVHPSYTNISSANVIHSGSQSLAPDNSLLLYQQNNVLVDKVGWGFAKDFEANIILNPLNNYSMQRKTSSSSTAETLASGGEEENSGNGWDTNDNSQDFVLQSNPNPRYSTYIPPKEENQPPTAVITGSTSTIMMGQEVNFWSSSSSDDGEIVGYQWSVDGEDVSSSTTFTYTFNTTGTYNIGLTVIDDLEASDSTSTDIIVSDRTQNPDNIIQNAIIYINEFLSDPSTSSEHEWIEIYNPTTSTVDLTGWTLSDSIGVRSSPTGTILAENFFVVELINVLNNTGDTIILKNPLNIVSDSVIYGISGLKAPGKGDSIARSLDGAGSWQETTTPTKNLENIITAPIVEVQHQSSGGGGNQTPQVNLPATNLNSAGQIIINELLPNPKGSDTENEFVELKNIGTEQVNLQDWVIADASSKYKIKEGIIHPGGFVVSKRSITNIALNNSGGEEVKLSNPAGSLIDSVKYSGQAGEDESYAKKSDGAWAWTIKLTPGAENIFADKNLAPVVAVEYMKNVEVGETAVFDASDSIDPEGDSLRFTWTTGSEEKNGPIASFVFDRAGDRVVELTVDDGRGNRETQKLKIKVVRIEEISGDNKIGDNSVSMVSSVKKVIKTKSASLSYRPLLATTLEKIRDLEIGDRVKVSGVVAVEPGVLGSQYFYIIDSQTGAGVQTYSNKKDFPDLKIGDKVEVTGELSESYGERRLKTKFKADIKKISAGGAFNPQTVEISEIGEDNEGALVQAQGEATDVKSAYLFLDDGTEEIKVAFKKGAGIDSKNFHVHDMLKITGIVGQTKSGYQIMPRGEADIEKIGIAPAFVSSTDSVVASTNVAETYLTATAGGLTSILIGLFARARGRLAFGVLKKAGSLAVGLIKRGPRV